ncbi:hypothetical protein ACIA59_10645 [Micromonospora haikouensis]|uniref:hypothetical protein n=1 Tax=Micromonospora haikouensis TaxID=686309 RepID=UPI0037939E08
MAQDQIITARVTGDRAAVAALRRLGSSGDRELREANRRIASLLAAAAAASARSDSRQAALMAPTIRVQQSRGLPQVVVGGNTLVGRRRKPAHKILFGSEFGSDNLRQFRPHLGAGSYWFLATIEEQSSAIAAEHRQAADRLAADFERG